MTAEDLAPYGVGARDADGWYDDYRNVPAHLRPKPPAPPSSKPSDIDRSWLAIALNWRIVIAELMERGVDLYARDVLARPWPGVRTLIFSLIDSDTRLRAALRKDPENGKEAHGR